jgi:hypothetical protein
MNQREWELLDKQLWGFSSVPPQNGGIVGLVVVAVFLAGMAVGGVLFTHDTKFKQIASHEAETVISLLNDLPPTMR